MGGDHASEDTKRANKELHPKLRAVNSTCSTGGRSGWERRARRFESLMEEAERRELAESRRADQEATRADAERQRADQEARLADEERRRAKAEKTNFAEL